MEGLAIVRNKDTVFAQLERRQGAAWRLLLSGGYLKVLDVLGEHTALPLQFVKANISQEDEVKKMFGNMIQDCKSSLKANCGNTL